MKTETATNYAKALYELAIPVKSIEETERIFKENQILQDIFDCPVIQEQKKHRMIERIFPKEMQNFLKVACDHQKMGEIEGILEAYRAYAGRQKRVLHALLTCVIPPDEERQEALKAFLRRRYRADQVEFVIQRDAALLGGFVLSAMDEEFDWSLRGRMKHLSRRLKSGEGMPK